MKKIFISYSHKDEQLMEQVVEHLKAVKLNLDIWVDRSEIDAGDEWESEIKKAIEQSSMAILLISTDFLNSKFITEKELPLLITKKSVYNYRLIPFILRPSSWDIDDFYKKLEVRPKEKSLVKYQEDNGDRDEILVDFAKEVKELVDTVEEQNEVEDTNELFYKTFAIFRVLKLYNKDEEYSFKLTSNLSIYKEGQEYPVEIWKFVDKIETIDSFSDLISKYYKVNQKEEILIGVVQKERLSQNLNSLSNFFSTLKILKNQKVEVVNDIIKNFYYKSEVEAFVKSFFCNGRNGSYMTEETTLYNINPVVLFDFSDFIINGYTNNELRKEVFDILSKKFKIKLTDDATDIFALKPFTNVFKKVLEYMDINKENLIGFDKLLSNVDILELPFKNINDLSFIKNNTQLIEENISDSIDININKLYVKSKAKFYYKNQDSQHENIDSLSNWIEDQIDSKDFLILLGDFGHGKTTFFKYMTAKLSKGYEDGQYIPVYLSLRQHFVKGGNLKDAVTNAVMPKSKMTDEFWDGHNWLIFCDGFDELSIYHQREPNWITFVFSMLFTQSKKDNIKIVLSSRPVLFLDSNVKKDTVNKFNRLILKPFDEPQITKWLENWSKYNKPITIYDIKERNLLEVSQTPVILFLIATIFYEELDDENISYSKSQIYKKFFDWTAKSGGLIQNDENIKHNVPDNYREILQEIAYEIFNHPDAKSGMLRYDILLKELSHKFQFLNLQKLLNESIFVAHAFKESIPKHIEFIHQSLREYLVAEKIFNIFYKFSISDFNDDLYSFDYDKLLLYEPVTQNKLDFIKEMIEGLDQKSKIKSKFNYKWTEVIDYFISSNTEIIKANDFYTTFDDIDNEIHQLHYFSSKMIIVGNIIVLEFIFKTYLENKIDFKDFQKMLTFLDSDNKLYNFKNLIYKAIKGMSFYEYNIENIIFDNFDLNNNTFLGVTFKGCSFKNTSLSDSTFCESGSPLYANPLDKYEAQIPTPTEFKNCIFDNVELFNTEFRTVIFSDCIFNQYKGYDEFRQFIDVEYLDCQFFDATFSYDFFKGVIFRDCIFHNSKFIDRQDEDEHDIEFDNCITKDIRSNWIAIDEHIWQNKNG